MVSGSGAWIGGRCLGLAALGVACLGSLAAAQAPVLPRFVMPARVKDASDRFADVRVAVRRYVREADLPGASMLVIQDGTTIYREHFGTYKDSTVVSLASASKWLTGATIMALVDEGKIDLDRPLREYLPEFTGEKGAITVRQLLSHTSGLPGDHFLRGQIGMTLAEEVSKIASDVRLESAPGTRFEYGGLSMQVAGRIAEVVTGKSWAEVFREKITGPLKMTSTRFGRLGLTKNPQLAGGASSTLDDYATFMKMIAGDGEVGGVRVLSADAVRQLCADQTRAASMQQSALARRAGAAGYGIGNWVHVKDAAGNGVVNSSPGAFGFTPWVDRERHVIGILMVEDRQRVRNVSTRPDLREQVNKAIDARSR